MRMSTLPTATLSQNFFDLLRGAEAADHFDLDGKGGKALLESFVVLEGEDGGGREHRDLLVVADGLEGGAHGDFSFAVADVAAEQAIHGELDSMSRFTSAMACAWSSVSLYSKASSNSFIHSVSAGKTWPCAD